MYKLSQTAKKPTKAKAFEMICLLKEGQTLYSEQIDSLLLYFAPALPKKPKSALEWLAKACDPMDNRETCKFVFVKKGRGIATNGHRVHEAQVDLPDGAYCPKTLQPVDIDLRWFDPMERVAERPPETKPYPFDQLEFGVWHADTRKGKPQNYKRVPKDIAVNESYLQDAVSAGEPETVYYGLRNSVQLLCGENEFGYWHIAGMRV